MADIQPTEEHKLIKNGKKKTFKSRKTIPTSTRTTYETYKKGYLSYFSASTKWEDFDRALDTHNPISSSREHEKRKNRFSELQSNKKNKLKDMKQDVPASPWTHCNQFANFCIETSRQHSKQWLSRKQP